MSFQPTTGKVAKLTISMAGGKADWLGPGINWKLNVDPKLVDKSNFRDGRLKNPTLTDATCNLTLVYDKADPLFKTGATAASVLAGASGTAKLYVDDTAFYTMPFVIGPVGVENPGMEDDVMVDLELSLSGGDITPPTYA